MRFSNSPRNPFFAKMKSGKNKTKKLFFPKTNFYVEHFLLALRKRQNLRPRGLIFLGGGRELFFRPQTGGGLEFFTNVQEGPAIYFMPKITFSHLSHFLGILFLKLKIYGRGVS